MAGPIFVVELEPGLWAHSENFFTSAFDDAQHFISEIQAKHRLEYMRRFWYLHNAKIVRIDKQND